MNKYISITSKISILILSGFLLFSSITPTISQAEDFVSSLQDGFLEKIENQVKCEDLNKGSSCTKFTIVLYKEKNNEKTEIILDKDRATKWNLKEKDELIFRDYKTPDGKIKYDIASIKRSDKYIWIILGIVILLLAVFGLRIYKVLISVVASISVIYFLIIPTIIKNDKFYFLSVSYCFLIIGILMFLNKGFNKKTFIAFLSTSFSLYLISSIIFQIYSNVLRINVDGINENFLGEIATKPYFVSNIYNIVSLISISGIVSYIGLKQTESVFAIQELKKGTLKRLQLFRLAVQKGFDDNQHLIPMIMLTIAGFNFFTIMASGASGKLKGNVVSPELILNNTDTAFAVGNILCVFVGIILIIPLSTIFTLIFIKYSDKIALGKKDKIIVEGIEVPERFL
jgi:uncharacterized membrane protein